MLSDLEEHDRDGPGRGVDAADGRGTMRGPRDGSDPSSPRVPGGFGQMPHYMFRASYTLQGIQGVMKEGAASRVTAVEALAGSVGGRILSAYWAFGDDDFIAIAELPDNAAAMAIAATVGASGAANVTTTVLLTAAEVDDALARRVRPTGRRAPDRAARRAADPRGSPSAGPRDEHPPAEVAAPPAQVRAPVLVEEPAHRRRAPGRPGWRPASRRPSATAEPRSGPSCPRPRGPSRAARARLLEPLRRARERRVVVGPEPPRRRAPRPAAPR